MKDKNQRIKELTEQLNQAAKSYEQNDLEVMSNYEYDKLYDELKQLEEETGIVLAGSPTHQAGYEVLSELPKERHTSPMLSLDKTKSVETLMDWLGNQEGLLSWKLDGLTVVLTYREGILFKAVTRGNGEIGEVVTNNARAFKNVPVRIDYQGELILRGEAVIRYSDFNKMNDEITELDAKYKNPRNLCSGSVRQLNNEITAQRNVRFYAFALIAMDHMEQFVTKQEQFSWLINQGFDVVEERLVMKETIADEVQYFSEHIRNFDLPSDGLVLLYNNVAYGDSLGNTAKFPRNAIAFKWKDEIRNTKLLFVEWSASRTGLINPVAVFEPVELEGTTVSRASLHNISIAQGLELGLGDVLQVYKANMIIPQIAENLTRSNALEIPSKCPVCGGETIIKQENGIKSLYCMNLECLAKKIKAFTHLVGRDALNMEGLSEATIEKLIAKRMVLEPADLFHLEQYQEEITSMEGLGEKSFHNLIASIEKARTTTLPKLIYSLGILNIGLANAKLLCKSFDYNLENLRNASIEELTEVEGIGPVIAETFAAFFRDEKNQRIFDDLLQEITLDSEQIEGSSKQFAGLTFVITGSLNHFENRNELKDVIERNGGKVTGSVTTKTNYLINNDKLSASSKNKKAKELGITVLTEEELLQMLSLIE